MERLKLVLLLAVALLLVYYVIDQERGHAARLALSKSISDAAQASRSAQEQTASLRQEMDALRRGQESLRAEIVAQSASISAGVTMHTVVTTPTTSTHPQPAVPSLPQGKPDGARDGMPRLGVNFLLPYDRSDFNPTVVGGVLRDFNDTPDTFNPILASSAEASDAEGIANDSLCTWHPSAPMKWSEKLATSAVISDDFKTYTFTIRRGVLWQRPPIAEQTEFAWLNKDMPLTAHDFVFYLDTVMNPEIPAPHLRNYYQDLESWKATDDYTLVLTWKRKVYNSLSFSLGLSPLPRHIYGNNRDGTPTSPSRFAAGFQKHWFDQLNQFCGVGSMQIVHMEADRKLVFRRTLRYWGAPGHFDVIEWDAAVKKPDAQLVEFKNGNTSFLEAISATWYKSEIVDRKEPRFPARDPADRKAGRKGPLAWEQVTSEGFSYIGWNLRRSLFGSTAARIALAHACPRERIIRDVFYGLGRPQTGPVHLDHPACAKDAFSPEYDLDKARALLLQDGWSDSNGDGTVDKLINGKRVEFRFDILSFANSPETSNLLAIYKNELAKIGVAISVLPMEWADLLKRTRKRDFDAVVMGWRLSLELDFKQIWHSDGADEPGSSNHVGYRNARVDALSDRLRETFDENERIRIGQEIHRIIAADQPYLFLRCGDSIFVWNPAQLGGVEYGLDAYHPLKRREKNRWFAIKP